MDTSKFTPEFLEHWEAEKQKAEKQIAAETECAMASLFTAKRALDRGSIRLDDLLGALALAAFQEHRRNPKIVSRRDADDEYYEGYSNLLGNAKRAILDGSLIVRQLTTLVPVNAAPGIQTWCRKDDTLKSIDAMRPHGRMVVKLEDARAWLGANGMPVPDWLTQQLEQPTAEADTGAKEKSLNDDGNTPLTIGERIRARNSKLMHGGCTSRIKTLASEFQTSESTIKKHLYLKKPKG